LNSDKFSCPEHPIKTTRRLPACLTKTLLKHVLSGLLAMLLLSCGNWGWESIDTDNQERLNVFGLISLDDSLPSFVIVHKTLDTAGPDQIAVRHDTVYFEAWEYYNNDTGQYEHDTTWYNPPWIRTVYESKYIVKNASVVISDAEDSYRFERSEDTSSTSEIQYYISNIFQDPAIYLSQDSSFIALPDHDYTLEITTPDGLSLNGTVHTPPRPEIIESTLADTLSLRNLFQISWHYAGDYSATIVMGNKSNSWDSYICGMEQSGVIEPGDTTWNSQLDSWCYEDNPDTNTFADIAIRLWLMDDNYDKYFLTTDSDVENISNFLIGEGSIGTAYGVEGGFGVFGAISADWVRRTVTP